MDGDLRRDLKTVLGIVVVLALNFSCATMPSDAPDEFHAARAGIDKAKDLKVQEVLPKTMDKAEADFAKAITMWKDAGEEKSPEKAAAMKGDATKMAHNVGVLTAGATDLKQNIGSWDNDISVLEGQYSIPSLLGQIRTLREDIARGKETISSPFAKVSGLKFQGPVAYFDTAHAQLDS